MEQLYQEVNEIPQSAKECFEKNNGFLLPRRVPYLGMGASYYALLTLYYAGAEIQPYIASEYYHYFSSKKLPKAVFISQSGETSDLIQCLGKFQNIITLTNNPGSSLSVSSKTKKVILLHAGKEKSAATKTYINTLITLYLGFGIDPSPAIARMQEKFGIWQKTAKNNAKKIYSYLKKQKVSGLYVLGSGQNAATAQETALALSETTKLGWQGMSISQYDHGPKETANNSIVIFLRSKGKENERLKQISILLKKKSNALVLEVSENVLSENLSPITLIAQAYLVMNYLTDFLDITYTYKLGGKVTKTR